MSRRTAIILIMAGIVLVMVFIKIMQTEAAKSTASETRDPNQIGTEMTEEEYVHWQLVQIENVNKLMDTAELHVTNAPEYSDPADELGIVGDLTDFLMDVSLRGYDVPEKYKQEFQEYSDGMQEYHQYWADFRKYEKEGLLEKVSDQYLKDGRNTMKVLKEKLANEPH